MQQTLHTLLKTTWEHSDFKQLRTIEKKPDNSLFTQLDVSIEADIARLLQELEPGVAVYGEESAGETIPDECWIIDPIDGTTNVLSGVPVFGSMIAKKVGESITHAAFYNPMTHDYFYAGKGEGAFYNGERLESYTIETDRATLLIDGREKPKTLSFLITALEAWHFRSFRRYGTLLAACHYLAKQQLHTLYCDKVGIYDTAPIALLASEVGMSVLNVQGNPWLPSNGSSVVITMPDFEETVREYLHSAQQ